MVRMAALDSNPLRPALSMSVFAFSSARDRRRFSLGCLRKITEGMDTEPLGNGIIHISLGRSRPSAVYAIMHVSFPPQSALVAGSATSELRLGDESAWR